MRTDNVNMDEDPSGWKPFKSFVETLREKYTKNEGIQGTFVFFHFHLVSSSHVSKVRRSMILFDSPCGFAVGHCIFLLSEFSNATLFCSFMLGGCQN